MVEDPLLVFGTGESCEGVGGLGLLKVNCVGCLGGSIGEEVEEGEKHEEVAEDGGDHTTDAGVPKAGFAGTRRVGWATFVVSTV